MNTFSALHAPTEVISTSVSRRLSLPPYRAHRNDGEDRDQTLLAQGARHPTTIKYRHVLGALALVGLFGCGSMPGERAVSGAGIGAGAGAVLGAVTGMGVGTGAAVGAAAGAAAGGLTSKKQIDLGKPVWKKN